METATIEQKIESALEEIRPFIAQHLGDIEFVKFENKICYVRMLGSCQGCPLSQMTLKQGVEELVKASVPEVHSVEAV
ncbi:MAG: NifU family protein [bacterium]|nr:NifU family protein [bacterium]